jgi:hypothetical protein
MSIRSSSTGTGLIASKSVSTTACEGGDQTRTESRDFDAAATSDDAADGMDSISRLIETNHKTL